MQKTVLSTLVSIALLITSTQLAFAQTGTTPMSIKDVDRIAKVKKI